MAEANETTSDENQPKYDDLPPHEQRTIALRHAAEAIRNAAGRTVSPADEIDAAKSDLKRFAKQLRKLTLPSSPVSLDLAAMFATSIENYLSGAALSMDAALGLTPKRGAPGKPERNKEIARMVLAIKLHAEERGEKASEK